MDCKEILENIDKYIEGRLTDVQMHKIRRHLLKCQVCNKEYEEIKKVFDILSKHEDILAPPNFTDTVMKRIRNYDKMRRLNQKTVRNWGLSFIASGLLIIFLNIGIGTYSLRDFAFDINKNSILISEKVFVSVFKITNTINEQLVERIDYKKDNLH